MKNDSITKKRWMARASILALAISCALVFVTTAFASNASPWELLDEDGTARTTEGSGSSAYNPQVDATIYVWRGATNNNIYFQAGYGDGRNAPHQAFPYSSSANSPFIASVRNGWIILHRGTDNRIYFTTNVGIGGITIDRFANWQPIEVNGIFETTNDTPSVTETTDGNVTVSYRGTDNNLYTVEGHIDNGGTVTWNNNRAVYNRPGVQQSSGWGPAIVSLANGSQRLFANSQNPGHAPFYMTRNSAYSNWEYAPRSIPGAPQYSTGRATARAIGNTLEVGYLEANYYGQPIPSSAEGYNMIRTAYDINRGWTGYPQADEQGWRENSGFSINVADEMHNVFFSQMMHSANRNNINQMYVKYESVFSLFK